MQDDVTMAIKNLKDALEEISMDAGKAQKREDRGEGTVKDIELIKWVESMEERGEKALGLLETLEIEVGNFEEWMEAK